MNPLHRRERELTDAEIEAIVAGAIAAEASRARREAAPPSSAIVWWRAQMRARQEADKKVERPLTIEHANAITCGIGLLVSALGTVAGGVNGSTAWLAGVYRALAAAETGPLAAIGFTSLWVPVLMTAMLISALAASIAYVIFTDE